VVLKTDAISVKLSEFSYKEVFKEKRNKNMFSYYYKGSFSCFLEADYLDLMIVIILF
jgi:hypothetical protein